MCEHPEVASLVLIIAALGAALATVTLLRWITGR